jgi:GAF domain-containing protein
MRKCSSGATGPASDSTAAKGGTMAFVEDSSEPKRMEEALLKVSRALKTITECHQALIRATNETELLLEVCRIIVEAGGYCMAWVGYAENDVNKSIRPVAHQGCDTGYMEQLQLTWADKERGRGPTARAIRLGVPVVCRDLETDPGFAFMREEACRQGYASMLALPLNDNSTLGP